MVRAWILNNSDGDLIDPHENPSQPVTLEQLKSLGVEYLFFDVEKYEENESYQALRNEFKERGFSYEDTADYSPFTIPNYKDKLDFLSEEHLHSDDEIRYCLEGSAWYDLRDRDNRWIRIAFAKGDLIVLPAGMHHRFILDRTNFIKVGRHYVGGPDVTIHHTAPKDELPARQAYVKKFLS